MRWHVHGTDAATGAPVVLGVNEPEAAHAVQVALSKRILVSRVVRGGWWGLLNNASLRRATLPLLAAAVVVLLPVAGALYYGQQALRQALHGAHAEQAQLAVSLRDAEAMLRTSQTRLVQLEAGDGRTQQWAGEVATTRQQLAQREEQLAAARKKLDGAQGRIKTLDGLVAEQRTKLAGLEEAPKKAAAAEARAVKSEAQNRALAGQMDVLKAQLLELAAHSTPEAKSAPEATAEIPSAPRPWGLRTGYDAASDFAALHFGKDSVQTSSAGGGAGGLVTVTATSPENACTFVMKTDRRRVFSATLKVSFAAGAPPEKVIQNGQVLAGFSATFAPGWKDTGAALGAAMKALADKDTDQRIVLLGEDYKATVWNNKLGLYSVRIESPREMLEEE